MAARRVKRGGEMHRPQESIVERLAAGAIRRGADLLYVEYKDGYEEIVVKVRNVGPERLRRAVLSAV